MNSDATRTKMRFTAFMIFALVLPLAYHFLTAPEPWPLHHRLLSLACAAWTVLVSAYLMAKVPSMHSSSLADAAMAVELAFPVQNLVLSLIVPSFSPTTKCWPCFLVFHVIAGLLLFDLPPMHSLLQCLVCLPFMLFLDFQKACLLASSSHQPEPSDLVAPAPASFFQHLSHHRTPTLGPYMLRHGLPMIIMGLTASIIPSIIIQKTRHELSSGASAPAPAAPLAVGAAAAPAAAASDTPSVPLESVGVHILSALGLKQPLLRYQRWIMHMADTSNTQFITSVVCFPICIYYISFASLCRFGWKEASMSRIAPEELMLIMLACYSMGRDSLKLDVSRMLQAIRARLFASQTLLVDMLPEHVVKAMLDESMGCDKQQQQQQQQQQQRLQQLASMPGGAAGEAGPGYLKSALDALSRPGAGRLWKGLPPLLRRRPARRKSSLRLLNYRAASRVASKEQLHLLDSEDSRAGSPAAGRGGGYASEQAACEGRGGVEGSKQRRRSGAGADLDGGASDRVPARFASPLPARPIGADPWLGQLPPSRQGQLQASSQGQLQVSGLGPERVGMQRSTLSFSGISVNRPMCELRASPSSASSPPPPPLGPRSSSLSAAVSTAVSHDCVTIFFSDICGFSTWSSKLPPEKVMSTLDELYCRLDDVILHEFPSLYKVETIGDAYVMAANLLIPDPNHAATAVRFALRAQEEAGKVLRPDKDDGETLQMRMGLHSGSIMSGIVGRIRRRFCLFGDTMNMAARTESSCPPGAIQVTSATFALAAPALTQVGGVVLESRGDVMVKGHEQPLAMFLVSAAAWGG